MSAENELPLILTGTTNKIPSSSFLGIFLFRFWFSSPSTTPENRISSMDTCEFSYGVLKSFSSPMLAWTHCAKLCNELKFIVVLKTSPSCEGFNALDNESSISRCSLICFLTALCFSNTADPDHADEFHEVSRQSSAIFPVLTRSLESLDVQSSPHSASRSPITWTPPPPPRCPPCTLFSAVLESPRLCYWLLHIFTLFTILILPASLVSLGHWPAMCPYC